MLPPPTLKKILFMDFKKKMVLIFFQVYMMIVSFNAAAQSANELFTSSIKARNIGNFDEAEKYLQTILNTKDSLTTKYKVAVYNQQGLIMKDLGRYSDALDNFEMAESICINEIGEDYSLLSLIYNNMAIIYKINNDYEKALEYYNVALNSLKDSGLPFKKKMYESSKIHHNIGNVYKHLKKFKISIESFELSKNIKLKYHFKGLENVYFNLAKTYELIGDFNTAESYYLKSIAEWSQKENSASLHKSAGVYNNYSNLLLKSGRTEKALEFLNISHRIYISSYGQRHPFTSSSFLSIGDFYFQTDNTKVALENYQKSIIVNTKTFNNKNIFSLPQLEDVIADIQFLKSLNKKSEALYRYSEEMNDLEQQVKILKACINTSELSLRHINNIRRGYMSKSSKLSITENEKTFYFRAIEASLKLFEITNDNRYKKQAYTYSQKSKASLLREEITQNKAFTKILPDNIRQKKLEIETNIYSFKKLIFDENEEKNPNKEKISKWSLTLFKLNNEYEDLITKIKENYADYEKLTSKTEIISLENLQKRLNKDETIVEYSLAPLSEDGHRKLFIFVVTKDQLNYFKNDLDSSFTTDINQVREQMNKHDVYASSLQEYNRLNEQLYHLYSDLIQPVEKYFKGRNIFVIPDEEIAYLSFDALQKQFTNMRALIMQQYLI
jgi:hypothetical protein